MADAILLVSRTPSAMLTPRCMLRVGSRSAPSTTLLALRALAMLSLASSTLAAQPRATRANARPRPASCLATSPLIVDALLDGRHPVYVEQETVVSQSDGRVLVAGSPVFVWERRGERYELVDQDTIVGMVVRTPSDVRAVASPLPGRSLTEFRSAALADGWWLVTFAEVAPSHLPPPQRPRVLAVWAGETDGTRWRAVERLPATPDSLETGLTSRLAWRDGRAMLAMLSITGDRRRVTLFTRQSGAWSTTAVDVALPAYVDVAATATHDVLVVVRPDTTEREDINSLFVHTRSKSRPDWTSGVRLVRGDRSPVRSPVLNETDGGLLLSWRITSDQARLGTAWSTWLDPSGAPAAPISRVTGDARQLTGAIGRGGGVWAVTDRTWPLSLLQLIEHDGHGAIVGAHASATTTRGMIGLALTSRHAVLIASRPARSSGEPAVISVIQSYPWRCQ